jgi:hypothetical protein
MVTQDGDHQFDGGEKQAGLRPLPRPQLQGSSSSLLGRRAGQVGACLRVGWRPASSSGIRGRKPSSGPAEEASSSHAGKANCCCLARVQHSVLRPGDCGRLHRGATQHIVRREGGTRVLGRSRSRSRVENGSEDLPVRFGAAFIRWRSAGAQVAAIVGAEVVAAGEGFSADDTVGATRGQTSDSLALIACPRPSSGDVGEGLVTVASALRSSLLLFSRPERRSLSLLVQRSTASHLKFAVPQALRCGGCSYPREQNRSSVCNGTLSVGVCSLWLSRPEHLGIWA